MTVCKFSEGFASALTFSDTRTAAPVAFVAEGFASPTRHGPHAAFVAAAEKYAERIAADLGIRPGCVVSLSSVLALANHYGGNVVECDALTEEFPGLHFPTIFGTGGSIFVAAGLPAPAKATVTLHELVHRLLYSDAYEGFNEVQHQASDWNRREFQKEVCRAVERIWVRHGGYDHRSQIRKRKGGNR